MIDAIVDFMYYHPVWFCVIILAGILGLALILGHFDEKEHEAFLAEGWVDTGETRIVPQAPVYIQSGNVMLPMGGGSTTQHKYRHPDGRETWR